MGVWGRPCECGGRPCECVGGGRVSVGEAV